MRKWLPALLALSFAACKDNHNTATPEKTADTMAVANNVTASPAPVDNPLEKLLGSYVGPFGDNKITLLIIKVANDSVEGRSIVGGNDRPFSGTYTEDNGLYSFTAKEPGDHPDDGVFHFQMRADANDTVTGTWKPNNSRKPEKQYALGRKKFEYKPDVGSYPEASQRLLKPEDVENLAKSDLQFMRNEIFARHGYCFKKKDLRQEFEMEDWYVPATVDIKGLLTDIEKKNIALIKRYEKYAIDYGDEYGR